MDRPTTSEHRLATTSPEFRNLSHRIASSISRHFIPSSFLSPYRFKFKLQNMVYVAQNPHVKIHDLAFVRFLVPDLPLERQFFLDFGLSLLPQSTDSTCYFKGKGVEPVVVVVERAEVAGFGGLGMRVKTVEELEAFASKVGGKVEKVGQGPWSGETRVVRLKGKKHRN